MADNNIQTRKGGNSTDTEHLWSIQHSVATIDGVIGQSRNRYMSAAATTWATATNECTWVTPGVWQVTIKIPNQTNLTHVQVVTDSPNEAYLLSVITAVPATTTTSDFGPSFVLPNTQETYIFSSPITKMDFLPVGTACTIYVEAT